jgi:hypothetical protein
VELRVAPAGKGSFAPLRMTGFGVAEDSSAALAQGSEDDNAADRKGHNAAECGDQHYDWAEVEDVSEYGSDGEDNAEKIEPERTANGRDATRRRKIRTQAELQEQRGYADGGDHHQCNRTQERSTAGVEDDQGKSCQQQASGDDGRTAWGRIGLGSGGVVGHGVLSPDLYRRGRAFTNWSRY